MNKIQEARLKEVSEAMQYTGENPGKGTRANIYIINPALDRETSELRKLIMKIIYDDGIAGSSDLGYEIVAKACDVINGMETLEGDKFDEHLQEAESASVYTADRLSYLNNNNHDEITDKMKEYDCDIETACAVWYDDMVRSVALELREYILGDDN